MLRMILNGCFFGVYGPNRRRFLWDELAGVFSWWNLLWCIGGDFDFTRFPGQWLGLDGSGRTMEDFSNFISDFGLMDIPLSGGLYTWSNNRFLLVVVMDRSLLY